MPRRSKNLDSFLNDWPYEFGKVIARQVRVNANRSVLQLRIDMGVLQMETSGRPDGSRPEECDTYYDYLVSASFQEGEAFELDNDRCMEIDREFVQFYHRRLCWLALGEFGAAASDAEHTLALMDFSSAYAPDREWADMHEQHRPFVMFHRTQALAFVAFEQGDLEEGYRVLDSGIKEMEKVYQQFGLEPEDWKDDEFVVRLSELRDVAHEQILLDQPLMQQLADAIAHEQYELAAEIRDRIARDSASTRRR